MAGRELAFDGTDVVEVVDGVARRIDDPERACEALRELVRRGHREALGRTTESWTAPPPPWAVPPDPPAFVTAVHERVAVAEGRFLHAQLLETYLSIDRFLRWARVLDAVVPIEGSVVLSSGCGPGGSLKAYALLGARAAIGVEVDAGLAELAALRLDALPHAMAVLYDGRRLPLPAESVDVVESIDVVEHVPDPDAYVAEAARVLRPGGAAVLSTPNRLWPVEQHLRILGPPWLPVPVANRLFSAMATSGRVDEDRRFRYAGVPTVREHNMSFASLRRLAKRHGLFLRRLDPEAHAAYWPLPRDPRWLELAASTRVGKFVVPVRTLAVVLEKR